MIYFLIYVDDILITSSHTQFINQLIHNLNAQFSLKALGTVNYFLGIEATKATHSRHLKQTKYVSDLLVKTEMSNARACPSPMTVGTKLFSTGNVSGFQVISSQPCLRGMWIESSEAKLPFPALLERECGLKNQKSSYHSQPCLRGNVDLNVKSESILMEKIIHDILKRLKYMFSTDNKDLVEVESMIEKIASSFWTGINDVCKLGIWGIGGIGKKTVASAVYNKISSQFESSYFTQNVREESENPNGLTHLHEKLLSTILEDKNLCIGTPNMGNPFIQSRLRNKKVFIVFDDVISSEQIEVLIGDLKCLGFGSRIIITTRDKQVLRNCEVDQIYHFVGLFGSHALKLFCQCAFKQEDPLIDYKELSKRAVRCVKGVPLALKVLGRHLQNRQRQCWESALDELEESPHMDFQRVLKISYDGLNYKEKDSFLNIACFFKGWNECVVKEIMDSCGLRAQIGISVLSDKALITISNNIITMHDLLQAMGREIVKQESIHEPEKRSRLWHHNDIYRVLTYNMCIDVSFSCHLLKIPDLSHATNLESLILEGCKSLLEITPPSIQNVNSLVSPNLRNCKSLIRLPIAIQSKSLRFIILSGCSNLMTAPRITCNMEQLCLDGTAIDEFSSSIEYPPKLVELNLENCSKLKSLPNNFYELKSLRRLVLRGCSNLKTISKLPCEIEELDLDGTAIKELSPSIKHLSNLFHLRLTNCSSLESLPDGISKLKSLKYLDISSCSKLDRLPEDFANLPSLEVLEADEIPVKDVSSIFCLTKLGRLSLDKCKSLDLVVLSRSSIIYPGNEIPKWFTIQSNRHFIELPGGSFNNIIGCAFCAILEFKDYHYNNQELVVKYLFETDDAWETISQPQLSKGCFWAWGRRGGPNYIESNHVCLGYKFDNFSCDAKATIIFQVTNDFSSSRPSEYCKIKTCGVHFFSEQDLPEVVEESTSGRCLSMMRRKRKRSKTLKFQNFINGEPSSR
ncbi:disease resistance protein RPP2B-like [Pistacia vera]|uniref:disease resistance protein RPP2B-like n=1 Tax=Pistacia vera TaxID=55513 RepID=UPI0012634EFE|nr:disease resistance protein RPP2B-like [Pistacia vera]